jgi:hypothetical protein
MVHRLSEFLCGSGTYRRRNQSSNYSGHSYFVLEVRYSLKLNNLISVQRTELFRTSVKSVPDQRVMYAGNLRSPVFYYDF